MTSKKTILRKIFAILVGIGACIFHIQQSQHVSLYVLIVLYPIGIIFCAIGLYAIWKGND